ncbi:MULTISPECIES: peptidoglycan-binding protein [unclassified Microcoleus]|uniref:peptidoglycan-binding protein n=1 Tax=unclassified Microcoleus TaxID=2642155 RepID=UPI002FD40B40
MSLVCDGAILGSSVRQLQSSLRSLGKNPARVNGVFGAETEFAVLWFQQECNLSPATGIATPATLAALQNGLAGRVAVPAVPISSSLNSRSSIQQLQRRLQDLGFYTGSTGGVLDASTRDAIERASPQLRGQQRRFVEPNFLAPALRLHQGNRVSAFRLIPEMMYFS